MFFLLRLCCASVSAYIFVLNMPNPAFLLYRFSRCSSELVEDQWSCYNDFTFNVRVITASLWMATWALLELRNLMRAGQPTPKLLTHLRYGPIAILIFSVATIVASDFLLIQYSRWQIVRWVHSDAPATEEISLRLYNNFHGWCGNGF